MRKARNYWEEICAILAILVGLGLTSMSWADTFQWKSSENPNYTNNLCNTSTSSWDCTGNFMTKSCVKKGSPGNPGANTDLYICGNTVWNGVQATQIRQYGRCNVSGGSCTEWGLYYCVAWNVYKDNICSSNQLACNWQGAGPGFCDPNNP
jgi:hypothetical protein